MYAIRSYYDPSNLLQARSTDNTYESAVLTDGQQIVVEGFDTSTSINTQCSATASVTVNVNSRPTGRISGTKVICEGASTTLDIILTGLAPWKLQYTDGTTTFTVNNILTSPHTITVTPPSIV